MSDWFAKLGRERIGQDKWPDLSQDEKIQLTYNRITDTKRFEKKRHPRKQLPYIFACLLKRPSVGRLHTKTHDWKANSSLIKPCVLQGGRSRNLASICLHKGQGIINNHTGSNPLIRSCEAESIKKTFWTEIGLMEEHVFKALSCQVNGSCFGEYFSKIRSFSHACFWEDDSWKIHHGS